jgi:tRNA(Ile)-lysidine synthase
MRLAAEVARRGVAACVEVATVDHGLRPQSVEEAERVAAWAQDCGLAHHTLRWEGEKPKTRLQEKARAARYALLSGRASAIGASLILTAHTLDDQAETVLMRIAHGSGLSGLAAMRPLSPLGDHGGISLARPFLGVAKARLVGTCHVRGWPYFTDPSNADTRFARARWRKLSAALAAEGLTVRRLAKLAERAASADEALAAKAGETFGKVVISRDPDAIALDVERLVRDGPREISLRVLLRALAELRSAGRSPQARLERVEAMLAALESAFSSGRSLKRTLGGTILVFDGKDRLVITREGPRRRGLARGTHGDAAEGGTKKRRPKKGNANVRFALV